MGLITPVGIGVEDSWSAICAGKSGVSEITQFDASAYQTQIAAEVKGFNAEDFMAKKEAKRNELFISYAMAATRMAMEDSGLEINSANESRVGVVTGCGLGGLGIMENTILNVATKGPRRVSPFFIPIWFKTVASMP
jgi:3-oxoacyl-[acyl-carrier-protein] synthase II